MTRDYQGDLAGLWAVGGKQVIADEADISQWDYIYCPECGWKLTARFSTCPRCGANLRTKPCPYCQGQIPVTAKACPRCTAPLS